MCPWNQVSRYEFLLYWNGVYAKSRINCVWIFIKQRNYSESVRVCILLGKTSLIVSLLSLSVSTLLTVQKIFQALGPAHWLKLFPKIIESVVSQAALEEISYVGQLNWPRDPVVVELVPRVIVGPDFLVPVHVPDLALAAFVGFAQTFLVLGLEQDIAETLQG